MLPGEYLYAYMLATYIYLCAKEQLSLPTNFSESLSLLTTLLR